MQWATGGNQRATKLEDAFKFFLLFFSSFLQKHMKHDFNLWETIRERAVKIF